MLPEALRPQHFAQSYSAWWVTGLAISKSHTFELRAVIEVQRCEGAVLEGVNVALKWRGGIKVHMVMVRVEKVPGPSFG